MTTTTTTAPTSAPRARRGRLNLSSSLEKSGIPIFLVLLILIFSLNPTIGYVFTSSANVHNILANQSVTGLIALGMVVPLVAGYFDLSVAAIAGLSNVAVATLIGPHGQPVLIGLVAGVAIGVLAGSLNGFLIAVLRLNPFVTTFGTYILIGGLLQFYTNGQTIFQGIPRDFGSWGSSNFVGLPRAFWLLMVVALGLWFLLTQTPVGRKLAAIGSNEAASRLVGFRVDRLVFFTFLMSGLLAGIAGALLTSSVGSADSSSATNYLFPALAAVFLGQTAIRPGHYNVWGTIFGVFLVAVAISGLTLLGAQSWVTLVFNGGALVLAVMASTFMGRARERRARAATASATIDGR